MDFDKYKIRISIRTCCLFEQLSGKNFFKMGTDEDVLMLMYASLVSNNDLVMSYKTFINLMQDKKVARWMGKEYERINDFMGQFNTFGNVSVGETANTENVSEVTMTDIASSLIMQHGVDPHYVMDEMQLWEIFPLFDVANTKWKNEMVNKRFWTYLQVMPQINTKKCKSPEDLVTFTWEREMKKSDFEKNAAAMVEFFKQQDEKLNEALEEKKDE